MSLHKYKPVTSYSGLVFLVLGSGFAIASSTAIACTTRGLSSKLVVVSHNPERLNAGRLLYKHLLVTSI